MSTILPLSGPSGGGGVGPGPTYSNGIGGGSGSGADWSSIGLGSSDVGLGTSGRGKGLPLVFRRLVKFRSMDFELAFWQLTYLVVAPRRVYKQTYHHKQTKNQWARDDPAMLLLIAGSLGAAGIAWSLLYRLSPTSALTTILLMIFRDFILFSLVTSFVLYTLANRLLLAPSVPHSSISDNRVEYAYAFDVAVNSFFPAFLTVYVGLLPLAAVVVRDNWVCLWVGNTLFLIAGVQYIYITYLGYVALPFVARSELFLSPLLPLFGGYLLSLLGFNVAKHALEIYFGQGWK
ncbi:UNC-50 family protein [Kwoniella heveanensis CBS 569]|uniref:UNC-50 family protein n=1 Tax=Kwoniella heveanensis BCC8398 TaxID=1296120 RepID=A0A1B9GNL3_9TREE|nr:UNC-50 family protein [Kwoniella heveanensis BCC8398]OCF45878.1 UNC-50 family protein [Kwoniella heveanensis CBS 569]